MQLFLNSIGKEDLLERDLIAFKVTMANYDDVQLEKACGNREEFYSLFGKVDYKQTAAEFAKVPLVDEGHYLNVYSQTIIRAAEKWNTQTS